MHGDLGRHRVHGTVGKDDPLFGGPGLGVVEDQDLVGLRITPLIPTVKQGESDQTALGEFVHRFGGVVGGASRGVTGRHGEQAHGRGQGEKAPHGPPFGGEGGVQDMGSPKIRNGSPNSSRYPQGESGAGTALSRRHRVRELERDRRRPRPLLPHPLLPRPLLPAPRAEPGRRHGWCTLPPQGPPRRPPRSR